MRKSKQYPMGNKVVKGNMKVLRKRNDGLSLWNYHIYILKIWKNSEFMVIKNLTLFNIIIQLLLIRFNLQSVRNAWNIEQKI